MSDRVVLAQSGVLDTSAAIGGIAEQIGARERVGAVDGGQDAVAPKRVAAPAQRLCGSVA